MARTRATVADVARLAGVSTKTVSRAFSEPGLVAPPTLRKVREAAQRLRFRPYSMAGGPRSAGSANAVGFMMGELLNPFYYYVAAGIEQVLSRHGLTMVVATTDDSADGEARVAHTLLSQRIGALLLIPVADDQSYLGDERQLGTPIVAIDRPARNIVADAVVLANREGAAEATRSLVDHGHRRIAFVCNPAHVHTQAERLEGYREALIAAGLPADGTYERLFDAPDMDAERIVAALLQEPEPPTAILAGNNRMCIGVLRATRGMSNPPALVGFDDFATADVLGVSVVSHDPVEMGRRAAQLALERMSEPPGPSTTVVLPTRLILRGSGERPPPS